MIGIKNISKSIGSILAVSGGMLELLVVNENLNAIKGDLNLKSNSFKKK